MRKGSSSLRAAIAALAFLFLIPSLSRGENSSWISLVPPGTFNLTDAREAEGTKAEPRGDTATVFAPVTLADGVDAAQVKIQLRDIRRAGEADSQFWEAFRVSEKLEVGSGRRPVIRITVDLANPSRQGTYNLSLDAERETALTQTQPLNLSIVRPAAKLNASNPIIDSVTLPLFGDVPEGILSLNEISGNSRVSEITFRPSGFSDSSGNTVPQGLTFRGADGLGIAPGAGADVRYQRGKSFPPGLSKGKVVIDSPNLEQPLTVGWVVIARRTPWLLALALLAGLLVGYVSRILLGRRTTAAAHLPEVRIEEAVAQHARWVIALVLIFGIGFALYEPTWTGVWSQIAAAFFWAFGLDVAINTVVNNAQQASSRSPAIITPPTP